MLLRADRTASHMTPHGRKRTGQPMCERPETLSLLPMEIQIAHRFTEGGFEWEVVTHPAAFRGGKSLCARIRRPGVPETEGKANYMVAKAFGVGTLLILSVFNGAATAQTIDVTKDVREAQ